VKLLKEDLKRIIREELEKLLDEISRRGFVKGASALCAMGVQAACQQDYELHNYPDKNLDGMKPPECLGEINLLFLHHDFEEGPIPEGFFIENYRELSNVDVRKDTGEREGLDDWDEIDYTIRVLFKNVPEDSKSWDKYDLRTRMESSDVYNFISSGEKVPFLIRSVAFYFPVKDGGVYANQFQISCLFDDLESACGSWDRSGKWNFTYPIGVSQEDSACEAEYRKFLEGPLNKPEEEVNETKRSKLRNKNRKSNR